MKMKISGKEVGSKSPTFLIAEIAQAHDGSIGIAHSYIDAMAEIGVDAIKFQTHLADSESTRDDQFRINFSRQDDNRLAYWKRMEFSRAQWEQLLDHAHKKGLIFMSSPFSIDALNMLLEMGVPALKLASGEIYNPELRQACFAAQIPLFCSIGLSGWAEIRSIIRKLQVLPERPVLMQCTSQYPTPLNRVGLNVIEELKTLHGEMVGLSDHSGTLHPSLAAMGVGAVALEFHVVFNKRMFGPDTSSSLNLEEVAFLKEHRDALHSLRSNHVDKDALADELADTRSLFGRSIALRRPVKRGEVISQENLTLKKPGSGIPPEAISDVVGKTINRDFDIDELLTWSDLIDN